MTLQAQYCTACRGLNPLDARFCGRCGAPSGEAAADPSGEVEQARVHAERGDLARARHVLEQALTTFPNDPSLRLALASICLQSGEYAEGLSELEQLRSPGGTAPVIEAYRAGALMGLGRVAEAKDVLDAAYTAAPDDFYVGLKRGELFCRLGIYPAAVEALERAVHQTSAGDPLGREAARRLLRFARDKARGGFVRRLTARTSGWRRPAQKAWGT